MGSAEPWGTMRASPLLPAVDWKSPTTGSIWPAHARAVRQVEYGKLFSRWAAAGCGSV